MTPTDVGRHCAACQTQVVDFTRMTDAEVVAFLRHTIPGRRCGRFREDQVGRPLLAAARPVTGWRRWTGAAVLLLGSVFGMKARAQGAKPGANERAMKPAAVSTTLPAVPDSLFLVQGVVRNRWRVRQEGVRVRIGNYRDTTNAQGYFRILIPQSRRGAIWYIVLLYWNPRTEKKLVAKVPFDSARTKPYHIRLKKPPVIRAPGFY
jgi:hypothetical protein